MLDSFASAHSRQSLDLIDDHFLSAITTLFIEEMALDRKWMPPSAGWNPPDRPVALRSKASIAVVPYSKQTEAIALKEYGTRKALPNHMMRRSRTGGASDTIRTFILGLSDAFNNLLMGIWGNLSLIGLTGVKSDPVFQRVSEMEHRIQTGSALINAVFGYLGERRRVAKTIRLNQLLQEINGVLPIDGERIKKDILHASLSAPTGPHSMEALAGNLSRILRQFVERLQTQYDLIRDEKILAGGMSTRLHTIERQMARTLEILMLLDRYAGAEELNFKRICTRDMLRKLADRCEAGFPELEISLDLPRRLPWIDGDGSRLQFVLDQLLKNSAAAMAGRGRFHIEAAPFKAASDEDRFLSLGRRDAVAITVSDTGHGMDLNTILHVFDPFFSHRRNPGRPGIGMGMAASWGIVKAHGGYIHAFSNAACGSTFKVYLPIRHR
jgi:signal transduction histidine kinase